MECQGEVACTRRDHSAQPAYLRTRKEVGRASKGIREGSFAGQLLPQESIGWDGGQTRLGRATTPVHLMWTRSGKSRAGQIIPTGANKIKVGEGCLALATASAGIWEWERPGREIVGSSLLGYHFHRRT